MRERFSPVLLVFKRELRDQVRDWRVLFPLFILTVVFPFLSKQMAMAAIEFTASYGGNLIGERIIPFFVLVAGFLPATVSLVIALESFVGEKERGTIEPLLSSPLQDWQLYIGKLLAGTVMPLFAGYFAIGLYLFLIVQQGVRLVEIDIIIQTFVLTAVQTLFMVTAAIAISTQSTSVRGANLLASFIIIPMAILIQGETVLMFWGTNQVLWWAVAGVALLAALLIRLGLAHFQREYLLGREIDVLNLRWMGQTFWQAFSVGQKSISKWYAHAVWPTLKRSLFPLLILLLLGLVVFVLTFDWFQASLPALLEKTPSEKLVELSERFGQWVSVDEDTKISAPFILGRNLRAVLIMFLAGIFSFGVLGILSFFLNIGLIGAALAFFATNGYSPGEIFIWGILPHGVFELPALLLATAVIFRMGAVMVTPNVNRTMGEVFLENLADWCKVVIGVVIPFLAIASLIETYITPALLLLYVP